MDIANNFAIRPGLELRLLRPEDAQAFNGVFKRNQLIW